MSETKQIDLIADDFKLKGAEFAHVFRAMMDSGTIADLSGSAFKVYVIIKMLSGFESGITTASSVYISEKAGLSKSQTTRAIKELKDSGLLFSERHGRRNSYSIIEKIPVAHKTGSPEAQADMIYSKKNISRMVSGIKKMVISELSGKAVINGDLNIQINITNIENMNVQESDDLQAEFSLVDNFNAKIDKKRV